MLKGESMSISVNDLHAGLEGVERDAARLHCEEYGFYRDFYRGGELPLNYIRRNPRESRKHWAERRSRLVALNYCAPIVDKIVRAEYSRRVARLIDNDDAREVFKAVSKANTLHTFQIRTARQRAIDGTCIVQVFWDDAARTVRLRHVLPEHFYPVCLSDHERIDAVIIDRQGPLALNYGEADANRRVEIFTPDEVGVFEGGQRINDPDAESRWAAQARYGMLPFVVFNGRRLVGDVFGASLLKGIAQLNHAVNEAANDVLEILRFQAFSLLIIQGALDSLPVDEEGRPRLAISESGFLNIDENGRVYFADPNPKISEILQVLESLIRMMFETGSVPVAAAQPQQSHAESATARTIQFMPLIDLVTELQTFDTESEEELIEKVLRLHSVHTGAEIEPGGVEVRFARNFLPADEFSKLQMNIEALNAGLKTKDAIIKEMEEE